EVPADVVEKERQTAEATARGEGEPEQALPKIIEGRLNGADKDVELADQPSVTADKKTAGDAPSEAGAAVTSFLGVEVGQAGRPGPGSAPRGAAPTAAPVHTGAAVGVCTGTPAPGRRRARHAPSGVRRADGTDRAEWIGLPRQGRTRPRDTAGVDDA